jgi:CYTH domain-containing protein
VPLQRLFIIAPSVARLIRKEWGGERVVEGYFPDQPDRSAYVQIDGARSSLILEARAHGVSEERADLPSTHAQALLAVSQGRVEYLRTSLSIGSHEILTLHFVRPGPLDLVLVPVAPEDQHEFHPLPWFGPEVSTDPAYQCRRLALDGAPDTPDVDVTNGALNNLLDLLEDRFSTWPQSLEALISDVPAAGASPSFAPVPELETEAQEEIDELGIEDDVIRELARALQPRRGG